METAKITWLLVILGLVTACGGPARMEDRRCPCAIDDRPIDRLRNARTFAVVLQNLGPHAIASADPDVVVVDYSWDGSDQGILTSHDINAIRARGGCPRLVFAYMSIGEAEDYRFYWKRQAKNGAADFIVEENPNWEGNFRVAYWDPAWHDIVYAGNDSYLGRIIKQGFDGVFLDTVDTAEVYADQDIENAWEAMAELIDSIAIKARDTRPDFLILAQNPLPVLAHGDTARNLSGVVVEDVAFDGSSINPDSTLRPIISKLKTFRHNGGVPFMIEYPRARSARNAFWEMCNRHGIVCYVGNHELSKIEDVRPSGQCRLK